MKHTRQRFNYKVKEFPLSGGNVPMLLRPMYRSVDVGNLFEFICKILYRTPFCMTNPVAFTLVNVTSNFAQLSDGFSLGPPPIGAIPVGSRIAFTFALTKDLLYNPILFTRKTFSSAYVTTWNNNASAAPQFITIGLSSSQYEKFGIGTLTLSKIQYLSMMLGAMTKNFVRRHAYYSAEGTYAKYDYSAFNLSGVRDKYFKMSLPRLMSTVPYKMWCFNSTVLKTAPQLICTKQLSPELALYYAAMVPTTLATLKEKTVSDLNQRLLFGDGGVVDCIESSILSFLQQVEMPGDRFFETTDLIAPMLIASMLQGVRLELHAFYVSDLIQQLESMVQQFQGKQDALSALLTPPKQAAINLLTYDLQLQTKLVALYELEVSQ